MSIPTLIIQINESSICTGRKCLFVAGLPVNDAQIILDLYYNCMSTTGALDTSTGYKNAIPRAGVCKVHILHLTGFCSIISIPVGLQSSSGMVPECRNKSYPWSLLDLTLK